MSYLPEFKGPIEGWVVNHATKNYWKVSRTLERADLMQEAYIVFMRCAGKYSDMDTPQHFMALYKTAWTRHFTDMANADTESRFITEMPRSRYDDNEVEVETVGDRDNDGALAVMLRQAPAEVKMVLNLFLSAPQEILDMALGTWNGADKRCKAGGSKKICQMLGLPPELDVIKITEEYFKPN